MTMLDRFRKQELPVTQAERTQATKLLKSANASKASKQLNHQRNLVQQKFNKIFSMSSAELEVSAPQQKGLLKNMQDTFDFNLNITEK